MLTLLSKPQGHKLNTTPHQAQIIDDGTGEALVYTGTAHGLADGDYVLIDSNFDSYNGVKYVDSISYDAFKIRDSENSDAIQFVQRADIYFYISILDHGFQCVHLPIVYEIESDLSPTNIGEEEYTPNTVVSFVDENGYTRISLSAALTNAVELSKIELVGDGPLAGVYRILNVYQPWEVVINLVYDGSNSFTGYQIVQYYDNYTINVKVYAGYPTDHRWVDLKPVEVAAILKLKPDADNRVKFSISEVLRSYIEVRNNLTLDTLPNNTDFSIAFHIGFYESYDTSDGDEITTTNGEETVDDFVGWAINSKLPFKSETGSFLSDYVSEENNPARWLTLFDRPVIVVGYFFDLSFLNRFSSIDILIMVNGALDQTIENPGVGVIRVPLEFDTEGEYCVKAITAGVPESGGDTTPFTIPALNTWSGRTTSPSLFDWVTGAAPVVNVAVGISEILYVDVTFLAGYTYAITVNYTKVYNSGANNPRAIFIRAYDNSFNVIQSEQDTTPASSTTGSGTLTFVSTGTETKIGISINDGSDVDITINTVTATETTPIIPAVDAQDITESICIDVVAECVSTITDDAARLNEDGEFRLLE